MFSDLYSDIKPLLFRKFRSWYLEKYDSRYKAFFSKIELILDNQIKKTQLRLDEYVKNNKEIQKQFNNLPQEYRPFFSKLIDTNLDTKENFYEDIANSNIFSTFIKPYFSENISFTKELKHLENSIEWYKDSFKKELDKYLSQGNVNIDILKKYKIFIIDSSNNLLEIIEDIIYDMTIEFYSKNILNLVKNPNITSLKLEKINENINIFLNLLQERKNKELYTILIEDFDNLLNSHIELLK